MMDVIHISFYFLTLLIGRQVVDTNDACKSPQYLELKTKGTISCSFGEDFYAVLWYNSTNYVTESPLVHLQQSVKDGYGYHSGEFDIYPNGSLVVNNVSLNHDHYYTAVKLLTLSDKLLPHYIRVIIVVKPKYDYPVISQCKTRGDVCFVRSLTGSKIECIMENTSPVFALSWMARTSAGDLNVSHTTSFTQTNSLYTSTAVLANVDLINLSDLLNLLVCKVDSPRGILKTDESLALVQNDERRLDSSTSTTKHFMLYSQLVLTCTAANAYFFVWQYKTRNSDTFEEIIYGLYNEGNLQKYAATNGCEIDSNMTLTISNASLQNEGQYGCMHGNGTHDGMVLYEAIFYAVGEILVQGCMKNQLCNLYVPWQGILTCVVKRIRPSAQLMWRPVGDNLQATMSFYDQQTTITHNIDDTFDISLTARYEVEPLIQHRQTVECEVFGTGIDILHRTTKVNLFMDGNAEINNDGVTEKTPDESTLKRWVIISVLLVVLVPLLVCTAVVVKVKSVKRRRATTKEKSDCDTPMLPTTSLPSSTSQKLDFDKKSTFIKQLKSKYEIQCAAICPLPFIRERLYNIERVFVEGQLMFLLQNDGNTTSNNWKTLDSYQNIFNDPRLKSSRRILEGEPGIGKSTLSLQFAYDWTYEVDESYLKDVEIFILLRLRQMGNTASIFEAIKKFLLPKDTDLTKNDIELMMKHSQSVVIVLDGFDEYPNKNKGEESDVLSIIKRDMLLDAEVILTTRSSCLPHEYGASATKRIKMTGFDENAREKYMRKAFVDNDCEAVERIKSKLRENPFLDDVCQIPLFFVMFAHLAYEQTDISTFNSVTQFFHFIISCLHNHMKNKMKDEDVTKVELFEHQHEHLDVEAFKALCSNSQNIAWNKETLIGKLGADFYDRYVKIGILVEEVLFSFNENPSESEDVTKYETEVTFYHKLFCEWYAAHFLANYAANSDVTLNSKHDLSMFFDLNNKDECRMNTTSVQPSNIYNLSNIDPYDLQYVYRFACGLNCIAAEKIHQYLKTVYGGDKFSLLCIVEQSKRFDSMKEHIVHLCSRAVDIRENQANLLQRSTIHLLEIASRQGIKISKLMLLNCFQSVESSGTYLRLKSGIKIPILKMLTKLLISDEQREIDEEEAMDILQFCAKCSELRTLQFEWCLMPQYIDVKPSSTKTVRNFSVLWDCNVCGKQRLCFHTGRWENTDGSGAMTSSGYRKEMEAFNKSRT